MREWIMTTNIDRDADVIRAAGALVWHDSSHGKLLAVVHRRRYGDDWSLPKGKLKKKETWLDAARREVQEETDCHVQVGRFAGVIGYLVEGTPKVVRFWHMLVIGEPGGHLDTEVDKVDWLPVAEACARLTYPLERAFVESAQPPLAGTGEG
jgi:8-oxo-dGTP pyrophosphatase MutT (NUDIX family)